MSRKNPDVLELLRDLKQIENRVSVETAGGSRLSKTFLMAYLALQYDLKNYVEIGVHRERRLFSMAYVAKMLNGRVSGIDAYDLETAREYDPDTELAFTETPEIIKARSAAAVDYFRENNVAIDMLYVNGSHNLEQVSKDLELYLSLVREGGVIVLDEMNRDSVRPVYDQLMEKYEVVFENGVFTILSFRGQTTLLQKHRLNILHSLVENAMEPQPVGTEFKVSVAVITYNQEKYIAECLDGIFAQQGDFAVEVIISDDCSSDTTMSIIQDYAARFGGSRFDVKVLSSEQNIGMTKNLQRTLAACTGDYIALCEGDDTWTDPEKLQKQVAFLRLHPDCSFCFHDFYMYFQEKDEISLFELQERLDAEVLGTRDLILNNVIGNFSCCMYDARLMEKVRPEIFDIYIADWMFNINYSRFGNIGHMTETLSMYRKHSEGLWTGKLLDSRGVRLHGLIEEYNKFLNYDFDPEFSVVQKRIAATSPEKFNKEPLDIAIIDDAFPHPLSAFRLQELNSYLLEIENLKIFSTGEALPWLGGETLDGLFRQFKRAFPELAPRIERLLPGTVIHTKSFYFIFLGTAYRHIDLVEKLGVPFVFTLYPGSVFGINNKQSDAMLKRITSSPCFRKVIVTQKITYDYLIQKKFCRPHQIEFIFGVVTPLEQMEVDYAKEKRFGINKTTLDICFVAHKYAPTGVDKGYDVFVEVARRLCQKYENIRFHVVGGFDRDVMDVTDLGDRITFYGRREMDWFDGFYKDKDIILSPNIPFVNPHIQGSFDGFPTASCTDAGLRKTAIFCTDELGLNTEFIDREEIVILPHNAEEITSILEHYYQHPQELQRVGEQGCRRIKQLYGYEAQILPRIKILKSEIERADRSKKEIARAMTVRRMKLNLRGWPRRSALGVLTGLKRRSPTWVTNLLRWMLHKLRSHEALFGFLKGITPKFLLRLLARLREVV